MLLRKLMKLCCSLCKTLRWFLIADDNHVAAYRSNLQFIDSQMYWFIFINRLQYVFQGRILGSKGGAVVRALASHQCGPGSNPGVDAICGLSLLLVLSLAPRGFSPGTLVFPSPQKPTFPNSNSTRNQVDEEPMRGCAILLLSVPSGLRLIEVFNNRN